MDKEILEEYSNIEEKKQDIEKAKNEVLSRNSLIFEEFKRLEEEQNKLEERQKEIKDAITDVMEDIYNKTSNDIFESEFIRIKFTPSYDKTIIDTKRLQKEYENVYLDCLKKTKVKSSVRITIK